jgi:hypothetical protein
MSWLNRSIRLTEKLTAGSSFSSAFGEREHLKDEVTAYLRELGRVVEEPDTGRA